MNWGRVQDTEHPTMLYSGRGDGSMYVARHVVVVTRMQFTVWLELPRIARPVGAQDVAQDGLAAVLMVQPVEPRSNGTPGEYCKWPGGGLVEPGFHGFLFVLIGDPIEKGHCTWPMGIVKAVPRFSHEPATYAVFYLGFTETLPPDNDLSSTSPGARAPRSGS